MRKRIRKSCAARSAKSFDAVIDFAREVKRYVPNVVMTTVETTIPREDEKECRAICEKLGVRYRIRAWAG